MKKITKIRERVGTYLLHPCNSQTSSCTFCFPAVLTDTWQRSSTGESHLATTNLYISINASNIHFSWFGWEHICLTHNKLLYMEISARAVLAPVEVYWFMDSR